MNITTKFLKRSVPTAAATAAVLLSVVGCAGAGQSAQGATDEVTVPAHPTTSAAAAPSTTASASTPAAVVSPTTVTPSTTTTTTTGTVRTSRCTTAQLSGSIDDSKSGQQDIEPYIIFTNTGKSSCTLQGIPGVSFVGGGNGTQIGPAALQERDQPRPTVTIQPGKAAQAQLIVDFANKNDRAECGEAQADGFRVYPPGETHALFIKYPYTACKDKRLMAVFPVQPR